MKCMSACRISLLLVVTYKNSLYKTYSAVQQTCEIKQFNTLFESVQ